jgi:hypothetical protein
VHIARNDAVQLNEPGFLAHNYLLVDSTHRASWVGKTVHSSAQLCQARLQCFAYNQHMKYSGGKLKTISDTEMPVYGALERAPHGFCDSTSVILVQCVIRNFSKSGQVTLLHPTPAP